MSNISLRLNKLMPTVLRLYSTGASKGSAPGNGANVGTSKPAAPTTPPAQTKSPVVGPGASKDGVYKNPEYYSYNPMSHYDVEKDMRPYRLKQPSSKQ